MTDGFQYRVTSDQTLIEYSIIITNFKMRYFHRYSHGCDAVVNFQLNRVARRSVPYAHDDKSSMPRAYSVRRYVSEIDIMWLK